MIASSESISAEDTGSTVVKSIASIKVIITGIAITMVAIMMMVIIKVAWSWPIQIDRNWFTDSLDHSHRTWRASWVIGVFDDSHW